MGVFGEKNQFLGNEFYGGKKCGKLIKGLVISFLGLEE
jgi:hypothetical protein